MSPNVGNFVHDLVEMAKAMETLPQVQAELEHAKLDQYDLTIKIDRLKADLEQSRTYAASLEQKVHTVEAERDDAEIRFLDLEEKSEKAVKFVLTVMSEANKAITTLDPPKPEPIVDHVAAAWAAQRFPPQVDDPSLPSEAPQPSTSQDQGEVNPPLSVNTGNTPEVVGQSPVISSDVGLNTAGAEDGGAKDGPYAGLKYYDEPSWISRADWITGGGTDDSYDWRPNSELRSF